MDQDSDAPADSPEQMNLSNGPEPDGQKSDSQEPAATSTTPLAYIGIALRATLQKFLLRTLRGPLLLAVRRWHAVHQTGAVA